MKQHTLFLVFLLVVLMCVSACSSPAQTAEPTIEPTPTATAAIRSKTSGRVLETEVEYKPIGVMIENSSAARPQTGLQAADVVYEAPVEGSITRFLCIFNDTLPEVAGPVRSARVYYMRLQQEWDCAYVHFGGSEYGVANVNAEEISKHINTRINFIKGNYNDYYWRSSNRSAPHNAYTNVQKLQPLMEQEAQGRTFLFDENVSYNGEAFSQVTLPFYGSEATYKYDESRDLLIRYQGSKDFMDAATDSPVTVQNLIVHFAHFHRDGLPSGLRLCDLVGTGKAEYFIGGVHIVGTWERTSFDSPTVYLDGDGNEIVLRPGNTWIAVHPDNVDITVE